MQREIGAVNAVAFDLGAACSGFLFALSTAQAYIASGRFKNALLIGAEVLSKIMDWNDRSTCVLFGDGAGAAVVRADEENICHVVQRDWYWHVRTVRSIIHIIRWKVLWVM